MSFRVDKVSVQIDLMNEGAGYRTIHFEFTPHVDDPLTKLLLEKNAEVIEQRIATMTPPTMGDLFIG